MFLNGFAQILQPVPARIEDLASAFSPRGYVNVNYDCTRLK